MISAIARKEITETVRDGRFVVAALIIIALLLVSLGIGAQRYSEDAHQRQQAAAQLRTAFVSQGQKNPHTAAHSGTYAFKPSTPLALFDPGYNDYTGTIQYLEAHYENAAGYRPAADATALQRFGDLSSAMVMQVLLPLLIILLCYGLFAAERERGTLRQLLSVGIDARQLLAGKLLGVAGVLGMVLLPLVIASSIIAWATDLPRASHELVDLPIKTVVLVLAYLVFFAIIALLAVGVSMRARRSGTALSLLVGFWIVTGLLVPRLGADLADALHPSPTRAELTKQIKALHAAVPEADRPYTAVFDARVLREYGVNRAEELPFSLAGYALEKDEEIGNRVFDATYGEVRRTFERQRLVHSAVAGLSPFVAIRSLSAALSGTDIAMANDFSAQAEGYRRTMVKVLNSDITRNARGMSAYSVDWGYRSNNQLWARVPPFDFDPPGIGTILRRNLVSIAVLMGWLAGATVLVLVSLRQIRPDA